MYIFLTILTIFLIIFIIFFIICFIIHNKIFGKRFELDNKINYYQETDFNCLKEEISFKIKNLKINGLLIYPKKEYDDSKIIIYCHGLNSSKEAYMQDVSYIAKEGFLVYCFDYIGINSSDGKNIGGLANGLKSANYAAKFIHEKFPDKKIYIIGHSWGAFNAINSLKYNPYIEKVCAISPFISINKAMFNVLNKLKFLSFYFELIEGIKYKKYAFSNSINTLKNYNGKALIIHSKDDLIVPFESSTNKLINKYKNEKRYEFLILENKNHNPQYKIESVKKLNDFQNKIKNLNAYELDSYMNGIDFKKLGELDDFVMNKIIDFFKEK